MIHVFYLAVENSSGERLELTNNHKFYDVIEIDGLTPPNATINTIGIAGADGTLFNNSKLSQRNVIITLNIKYPVKKNRLNLYRFFRVKQWIRVFYKSGSRNVYIEGYIESFEDNFFVQRQTAQISIICPDPYWKNHTESVFQFSNIIPMFEFPFCINSYGAELSTVSEESRANVFITGVSTGGIIELTLNEDIHYLIVKNNTTNERFLILTDLLSGDKITINTNFGKKSVKRLRNGVETNLINERKVSSTWLQFRPGNNEISCTSSAGAIDLSGTITVVQKYEGV